MEPLGDNWAFRKLGLKCSIKQNSLLLVSVHRKEAAERDALFLLLPP